MFPQYGQQTPTCSKRWWFKTTWKNTIHRHDLNMVSKSKVSISIMFRVMFWRFLSFDIPIVSKILFPTCFHHVSYMFLLFFPISIPLENKFCITSLQRLCHYFLFQLYITSFYNFFFYVSNILNLLLPVELRETWFIWLW
jgi:hypothetical protein